MKNIIRNLSQRIFLSAVALSAFFSATVVTYGATDTKYSLQSPLKESINSIPAFISEVLKAIVTVGLPIITLFIVISGFMFLFAQGNSSKIEEAKKNFMWVIVGTLLILGAWVLVTLIAGTVTQLVGKT